MLKMHLQAVSLPSQPLLECGWDHGTTLFDETIRADVLAKGLGLLGLLLSSTQITGVVIVSAIPWRVV